MVDQHAAYPVPVADPHLELFARFLTILREGTARFCCKAGARLHHRGRRAGKPVLGPRAAVHIPGRPAVLPITVPVIGEPFALIALAGGQPTAKAVSAYTFLSVLYEIALVAIAVRPGLHAAALLHSCLEVPPILRAPARHAVTLGEPVRAGADVLRLQLRIEHAARLRLRHPGEEAEHSQKERLIPHHFSKVTDARPLTAAVAAAQPPACAIR